MLLYSFCIFWITKYNNVISRSSNFDFIAHPWIWYNRHYIIISITNTSQCVTQSSFCRMSRKSSTTYLVIYIIILDKISIPSMIDRFCLISKPNLPNLVWPNSILNIRQISETIINFLFSRFHNLIGILLSWKTTDVWIFLYTGWHQMNNRRIY